ncbi:hypothetical protein BJV82DRAFT_670976 [Fennellomyces sp. T-0311]|nr:hypothetical protein BJV82DRAFT_670976 [Fennellomyces sp. T-0311]
MFRALTHKFHHGDIGLLQQLRVWYIHARGKAVHLWAMQMPSSNVFVLERVAKASIPSSLEEASDLTSVTNLLWLLKLGIDQTIDTITKFSSSHHSYIEDEALGDIDNDKKREDLRKTIAAKVQKPTRGAGYGDLLPDSFTRTPSFSDGGND